MTRSTGSTSLIGAAEVTLPPHEQIGTFDMDRIRRTVAGGHSFCEAVLHVDGPKPDIYSSIDLIGTSARADPALAPAAAAALRAVPAAGHDRDLAALIEITLADLTHDG
ncbi:hypothetical protein GCM10010112_13940 [Actinoplanes lobatus]|uniref:Uncharacterized protein n=1 Tax=Actinoplanes lobatus TaxID=113568 RepID=A0A7W7MK77_9ACTN|nr:hypothetical protein [Actinoplanes lobatus]MBB4753228.1 hypothetical protein [Actinoplanes lobatus]GGN59217.1 hypothetical protein GCM10010112_13940 [Actinoplanes lobatus]GIE42909.1 hypothetical protein Alo02nite_58070 [Actinoplanes lobatus]